MFGILLFENLRTTVTKQKISLGSVHCFACTGIYKTAVNSIILDIIRRIYIPHIAKQQSSSCTFSTSAYVSSCKTCPLPLGDIYDAAWPHRDLLSRACNRKLVSIYNSRIRRLWRVTLPTQVPMIRTIIQFSSWFSPP